MKYCEEFAALLDLYVDGELSGEEAARVREHLANCPGCQRYVDGALAVRAAFPEVEETVVPEGFTEGVMAAVRAEEEKNRACVRKNSRWKHVLLPLAACVAIVLVLRTVPGGGGAALPAATDTAAPASMDAVSAPAGDSGGEYGSTDIAPQMAEETPSLPEAQESGIQPRAAAGDSLSEPAAPAVTDAPPILFSIAPQAEEGGVVTSTAGKASADERRAIRLTAEQAGDLLTDLAYTVGEDGARCYQLPGADFDALLAALAEREIVPEEEMAPMEESLPEGYDLVYVTEE